MNKTWTSTALAVAAVAGIGIWWSIPAPLPVKMTTPSRGDLISRVVNTRAGTIKSCQRAGLSLPTGGVVDSIAVKAGDRVRKGQTLLTLWHADQQAELARVQAVATLNLVLHEQSCSLAEFHRREAVRLTTLRARDLTSASLSEQAQSQAETSRLACLAAAEQSRVDAAQIDVVKARLSQSQLIAPFDGVVAEVNSKLGEYMTPSPPGVAMPPVVDLIDDQCLYVSAPIDEIDAARLKVGQPASILLDALPERPFPARVRRIAPYVKEMEKQARTVEVEAEFTPVPADLALLIGYSADVEIEVARHDAVLRLPATARRDDGSVLRLSGDHLEIVKPAWGLENWNWLEIRAGLKPDDQLVLQPGKIKWDANLHVRSVTDDEPESRP